MLIFYNLYKYKAIPEFCYVQSAIIFFFRSNLLHWHQQDNTRQLPWKGEQDVYRIWISEIILQQTRAEQGLLYYRRFLDRFPNLHSLARAPLSEVYRIWEGLGYYSRARNLHATACLIVKEYRSIFPSDYSSILSLKGIGPYTAAAIASFAFRLPYAVVDGNVVRVLSRFFGSSLAADSTEGKKWFSALAQKCLDSEAPHIYNQAIMDFGATVCKPDNPNCTGCVFRLKCVAYKQKRVAEFPVKKKPLTKKERYFIFYALVCRGKLAIQKRSGNDIWKDLYQLPLEESENKTKFSKVQEISLSKSLPDWQRLAATVSAKQVLSHQRIHARAIILIAPPQAKKPKGFEWISLSELPQFPLPRILHLLLKGGLHELLMLQQKKKQKKS